MRKGLFKPKLAYASAILGAWNFFKNWLSQK